MTLQEFLAQYAQKKPRRFHMPGHKGKPSPHLPGAAWDITEIPGADNLAEPTGFLLELQRKIARHSGITGGGQGVDDAPAADAQDVARDADVAAGVQGAGGASAADAQGVARDGEGAEAQGAATASNARGAAGAATQTSAQEDMGATLSVQGATGGILAAMLALCTENSRVLCQRQSHTSVISGLVLTGARPVWLAEPRVFDAPEAAVPASMPALVMPEAVAAASMPALATPEASASASMPALAMPEASVSVPALATPEAVVPASPPTPEALEAVLRRQHIDVAILTRPTYDGQCGDAAGWARVCHAYGVLLLVDEAHGGNLWVARNRSECGLPPDAAACGADAWVCSAHKTLPVPGQTAWVAARNPAMAARVARCMRLIQTTSPNYTLLAGLEGGVSLALREGPDRLAVLRRVCLEFFAAMWKAGLLDAGAAQSLGLFANTQEAGGPAGAGDSANALRGELPVSAGVDAFANAQEAGVPTGEGLSANARGGGSPQSQVAQDWTRLRVDLPTAEMAQALAAHLSERGLEPEAVLGGCVLFIVTMADEAEDILCLQEAVLRWADREKNSLSARFAPSARNPDTTHAEALCPVQAVPSEFPSGAPQANALPIMALTPRQAALAVHTMVPLCQAQGRVAAQAAGVYPPGVPLIVPGEVYTPEIAARLLQAKSRFGVGADGVVAVVAQDGTGQWKMMRRCWA